MVAQTPAESLLALVASVFDAYSVVLFQPEDETGKSEARLTAFFSLGDEIARGARIPPGKGLVGWILRNKAPLLVDSIDQNQAFLGYYQEQSEPDIRSFMGCPVPGGGALCIDSKRAGAFTGSRQKLLHLFALMIPQLESLVTHSDHDREVGVYFAALERMADLRASYAGWGEYMNKLLALLKETTGFHYVAFASRVEGSARYIVEGECPPLLNRQGNQADCRSTAASWAGCSVTRKLCTTTARADRRYAHIRQKPAGAGFCGRHLSACDRRQLHLRRVVPGRSGTASP